MIKLLLFKISVLLAISFFCTVGHKGYAQANPTVRIILMGNNQCVIPDRQLAGIGEKACHGNTFTYGAIGNNITQYRWTVTAVPSHSRQGRTNASSSGAMGIWE